MTYYEILIIAVHKQGGYPKQFHKNLYNVKDSKDLAGRVSAYIQKIENYEVVVVNVVQIQN